MDQSRGAEGAPTRAELGPEATAADVVLKAREDVDQYLGNRLRACERMRDLAVSIAPAWTGCPMEPGLDRLIALLWARTSTTYWAIVELLRMAFGEQAAMLTRSLFEDMVDMHLMSVEPQLAVERFQMHGEHSAMVMTDALRSQPNLLIDAPVPVEYDPQRRSELDRLFGPYGDRGWSGRNIHRRVEAIQHLWEDPDERMVLNFSRTVAHRVHNEALHVSNAALSGLIRSHDERGLHVTFGPNPERVSATALASFWTYSQALRLFLTHFTFPAKTLRTFETTYAECWQVFQPLGPETPTGR